MPKETVIALAPYPVSLPNGQHLRPGEIAEISASPELTKLASSGLIYIKPTPIPPVPQAAKRAVVPSEEN